MSLKKRIAFYETDMMGVVHHSNYLRYFEDARLQWLVDQGLVEQFNKVDGLQFAVVNANVNYIKAASYGEEITINCLVRKNKARLHFEYEILNEAGERICTGSTTHVTVDKNLKVHKIPPVIAEKLENLNG